MSAGSTVGAQLLQAQVIASVAHQGQTAKTGEPLIDHVARVAAGVRTETERTVAWLHDVLEKCPDWSLERLSMAGFDDAVVQAVDALSKRPGEEYLAFCRRAIANPLARPVKRADLLDNLDQARRIGSDTQKYEEALRLLTPKHP
jgi:hypothetical protein